MIDRITDIFKSFKFETYNDYPQAASDNAKIALRWAEENGWGDCGTQVGKVRANQLANRESISRETIARMSAFERHRQNSQKKLGDGCGRLVWLMWGGDEGVEWAQRKLKQIDTALKSSAYQTLINLSSEKFISVEDRIQQLRDEEQKEYDLVDTEDKENIKEIYDRYDKLITPLLEVIKK
jgi:hypothetical protein